MTALNPVCAFCDERHDPVQTEIECDATRARTTAGRWLIVEQQIGAARSALQIAEKELAALDVMGDADLPDELGHFRASFDATCSNLTVSDAFAALLVRKTGAASQHAFVALKRERDAAAAKSEAMQTATACGGCQRADVALVGAASSGSKVLALCAECLAADVGVANGNRA